MPEPKLVVLDMDGTLIESYMDRPDRAYFPTTALPGRREKLAALDAAGVRLAVLTNQAGVAFGHVSHDDVSKRLDELEGAVGVLIPTVVCSTGHPAADPPWNEPDACRLRKPLPDGLLAILEMTGCRADETLMVGDRPEDQQCAVAAGVAFEWAENFFAPA